MFSSKCGETQRVVTMSSHAKGATPSWWRHLSCPLFYPLCYPLSIRVTVLSLWLALPCAAAVPEYQLVIKDHLFSPSQLQIPANQKVKIVIHNHDDTPEEFESFSLNREKVILPRSKGVVFVGPLPPGEHAFFGEYNPDTAKGVILIRAEAGDAD
jgi:hypothetical protein